jgi:predicted kinase
MRLIIVSGATATGKTTLAKIIADNLGYTLYTKDAIKEEIYDSQKENHGYFWYERKAKDAFFSSIQRDISIGKSIVIENNFMRSDKRRLKSLLNKNVQVIEIYCKARGFTRLKRFINRGEITQRHKAHSDRKWYPTVFIGSLLNYIGIQWPYGPVGISNKILNLDTTDVSKINIKKITKFLNKA